MNKRINGMGGVVGAVVAALGLSVGCGGGFASGGCQASRTCGTAGEGAHSGTSGSDATAGAADGGGGSDATMVGGAAGMAGDGGAAGADGCDVDADCSNGVAEDGAEVCDAGACRAGNPPPTIVSFTPEDDAMGVEPDTSVVIEFSEPLDPTTVNATNIQVLDGETPVPGKLGYANGKVTFTPTSPLALLAEYKLSVTKGVSDAAGAPLLQELASTFVVRDGAWHEPTTVAKDTKGQLSFELPMTADGNVLLVWSGTASSYCPAWARWYLRGLAQGDVKALTISGQTECSQVSSASNAAGVAAVVWQEPDGQNGLDVSQQRAGAWDTPVRVSPDFFAERPQVAVSPSGVTTLFDHSGSGPESRAWTTDGTGNWPAQGDVLSPLAVLGHTSVAFDAKGNGLAAWRASTSPATGIQRVAASRFTPATGKWSKAVDLPGSVTATESLDHQRGIPVVAMDGDGGGMALWVDASNAGKLMASRFAQSVWAEPVSLSGANTVDDVEAAPALVFDGQSFVAAWTAKDSGNQYTYTARYDLKTGWQPYEQQQAAADGTSAPVMPALVSDGRGNLLLVFARGADPTYSLAYQRYSAQSWGPIAAVPGGTIKNQGFVGLGGLRLSMSPNGLAALAWTNYDAVKYVSAVRLASFY
jgi:hypothetical protein